MEAKLIEAFRARADKRARKMLGDRDESKHPREIFRLGFYFGIAELGELIDELCLGTIKLEHSEASREETAAGDMEGMPLLVATELGKLIQRKRPELEAVSYPTGNGWMINSKAGRFCSVDAYEKFERILKEEDLRAKAHQGGLPPEVEHA